MTFDKEFTRISKWQAHVINVRNNELVVCARICRYLLVSATNFGEVKLWSKEGKLLGTLGINKFDSWPYYEINRIIEN